MGKPLIETAKSIQEIIASGHRSREVFSQKVVFRAEGDRRGESTRQIGTYKLKRDIPTVRFEENGYMAGGIGAPWLESVILPSGLERVDITADGVTGLTRGVDSKLYHQIHNQVVEPVIEENKKRYQEWRETGREPNYVPDSIGFEVYCRAVADALEPLDRKQLASLETGLSAFLLSLKIEPQHYILEVGIKSRGKV